MAMKKSDMEAHRNEHNSIVSSARLALHQLLYGEAIRLALSAFEHIDGMMQYERKYGDNTAVTDESIKIVLEYAPYIFDLKSLDMLDDLLKNQRRIAKEIPLDVPTELAKAKVVLWQAYRLWNRLDAEKELAEDVLRASGGNEMHWQAIANAWASMGLIRRIPQGNSVHISLSSDMDSVILAKCSRCGAAAKAPKAAFLKETTCPKCRARVLFVFMIREAVKAK